MAKVKTFHLYIAITLAMIFWAMSFIWTKIALQSFRPITLITLRLIIASILLLLIILLTGNTQRILKKDIKWFVLLAFFEPYLYYLGETFGLTKVSPTIASVIISTIPLFSPIFAFLFLKEKVGLWNILGIIVSLVGVCFVIYEPRTGFYSEPFGIILLFFAVFSGVFYSIILKKISIRYSTLNIIFYQSVLGLLFFLPTFLIVDLPSIKTIQITHESILALILLAIFASVVAYVLFASVLRRIGVVRSNVFSNLIPAFTAIFTWLILREPLSILKLLGIAIVISGLFVSQLNKLNLKKPKFENINF
ncbi:MAG TPA: DMT family transporter [Paludibacteraceae bacterium]|nr:DMT family transporter [Paludibacteraceae bacterium]HOL00811.1 DMT family transporter [Paludibacteraceae bacterium]HPO67681.1 DMT family transporter [Paludibacteraceae bacterium]